MGPPHLRDLTVSRGGRHADRRHLGQPHPQPVVRPLGWPARLGRSAYRLARAPVNSSCTSAASMVDLAGSQPAVGISDLASAPQWDVCQMGFGRGVTPVAHFVNSPISFPSFSALRCFICIQRGAGIGSRSEPRSPAMSCPSGTPSRSCIALA